MIQNNFDPNAPYRVYIYARMSSDMQNARSPEQQFHEVQSLVQKLGYPWQIVGTYRDDATSGKYLYKNRPGLQEMLTKIRTGSAKVDLILLDTFERLGRSNKIAELRQELAEEYGVLILTADQRFADPTTPQASVMNVFDAARATEENRIKSHQVSRGKRDIVRLGYWPGGAPPFGYKLVPCMDHNSTSYSLKGSKLEIDPTEGPIVQQLFQRAAETGHGASRLARWLNDLPEMPDRYKPVHQSTVRYWLKHSIYLGILRWGKQQTDICKDARIIRPRAESDWVTYEQFCDPLVSEELFQEVQANRAIRRNARKAPQEEGPSKLIRPLAGGIGLVYPLSGLVVCGECGGHMHTMTSGRKSKAGKTYVYYGCDTASVSTACSNKAYVPESWLREVVIGKVQERILGSLAQNVRIGTEHCPSTAEEPEAEQAIGPDDLTTLPWFTELVDLVTAEMMNQKGDQEFNLAALSQESKKLEKQVQGWLISLSNVDLPTEARRMIELQIRDTSQKRLEIQTTIERLESGLATWQNLITPEAVVERLNKLASVLALVNPSRMNIELALHIDAISCFPTGQVCLRLCRLGLVPDMIPTLSLEQIELAQDEAPTLITPRRRTRRKVTTGEVLNNELHALTVWATDPHRFKGLPDNLFEQHQFEVPKPLFWYQENSAEIAEKRKSGMSQQELADYFETTMPTIRKALKYAKLSDPELARLPAKRPRPRWHEENVQQVLDLLQKGMNIREISNQLGKSEPTIWKAVRFAEANGIKPPPTG